VVGSPSAMSWSGRASRSIGTKRPDTAIMG
jgi:hypothetical protein